MKIKSWHNDRGGVLSGFNVGRCVACSIYAITALFLGSAVSKDHDPMRHHGFYPNCGLSLSLPGILVPTVDDKIDPCADSYREQYGATMLLGTLIGEAGGSSLIDKLPILHIYKRDLDSILTSSNGSGLRRTKNGIIAPINKSGEMQCGLSRVTRISNISGVNWRGWVAEDTYKVNRNIIPIKEFCQRFNARHRCIRLVIGNLKEALTMSQYCFVRRDEDFDLDAGLSYRIFSEIIKSIKFSESD